jgi:hypothetical protein
MNPIDLNKWKKWPEYYTFMLFYELYDTVAERTMRHNIFLIKDIYDSNYVIYFNASVILDYNFLSELWWFILKFRYHARVWKWRRKKTWRLFQLHFIFKDCSMQHHCNIKLLETHYIHGSLTRLNARRMCTVQKLSDIKIFKKLNAHWLFRIFARKIIFGELGWVIASLVTLSLFNYYYPS